MVTNVDVGTINTKFFIRQKIQLNAFLIPRSTQTGRAAEGVQVWLLPYKSTHGQFVTPLFPSRSLLSIIQVKMRLVHNFHNGSEQLDNTCFICYSN